MTVRPSEWTRFSTGIVSKAGREQRGARRLLIYDTYSVGNLEGKGSGRYRLVDPDVLEVESAGRAGFLLDFEPAGQGIIPIEPDHRLAEGKIGNGGDQLDDICRAVAESLGPQVGRPVAFGWAVEQPGEEVVSIDRTATRY